jgi:hypothetical protein
MERKFGWDIKRVSDVSECACAPMVGSVTGC